MKEGGRENEERVSEQVVRVVSMLGGNNSHLSLPLFLPFSVHLFLSRLFSLYLSYSLLVLSLSPLPSFSSAYPFLSPVTSRLHRARERARTVRSSRSFLLPEAFPRGSSLTLRAPLFMSEFECFSRI